MRALLVEDNRDIAEVVRAVLYRNDIELFTVSKDFPALMNPEPWENVQIAIVDILLGSSVTGLDVMEWLDKFRPDILRIAFTAVPVTYPETKDLADAVVVKDGTLWPDRLLKAMGVTPKVI